MEHQDSNEGTRTHPGPSGGTEREPQVSPLSVVGRAELAKVEMVQEAASPSLGSPRCPSGEELIVAEMPVRDTGIERQ